MVIYTWHILSKFTHYFKELTLVALIVGAIETIVITVVVVTMVTKVTISAMVIIIAMKEIFDSGKTLETFC